MNSTRKHVGLFLWAALSTALSSCASLDRTVTKFEPIRIEGGSQIFKFTAFADAVYPLVSDDAEKTRLGWLETWLRDNGYDEKRYEIMSRTPILKSKGVFGDVYDIFYEVRAMK